MCQYDHPVAVRSSAMHRWHALSGWCARNLLVRIPRRYFSPMTVVPRIADTFPLFPLTVIVILIAEYTMVLTRKLTMSWQKLVSEK
jgi:hypothetical protein